MFGAARQARRGGAEPQGRRRRRLHPEGIAISLSLYIYREI